MMSMVPNEVIDRLYAIPDDGGIDDWTIGLVSIDGKDLKKHLGGEHALLQTIQKTGEHLQTARHLVAEFEQEQHDADCCWDDDIQLDHSKAVALVTALSQHFRSPSSRFFNQMLAFKGCVIRATQQLLPAAEMRDNNNCEQTEEQYHASITEIIRLQIIFQRAMHESRFTTRAEMEEHVGRTNGIFDTMLQSFPQFAASTHVLYGNFCLAIADFEKSKHHLSKAVALDEIQCYGAYHTMANILQNELPGANERQQNRNRQKALRWKRNLDQLNQYLTKYLELAPVGHWFTQRACMTLILFHTMGLAKGKTEGVESIARRHADFPVKINALFRRGVEAVELYEQIYGREEGDFKNLFRQAANMVSTMHEKGLLLSADDDRVVNVYLCGNPECNNTHTAETPLSKCARCETVRYCGRDCQVKHWKCGHKQDCKRLAKEREAIKKHPSGRLDHRDKFK